MVEKNVVEVFYAVHLLKNSAKEIGKVFICTKRRGDEVSQASCFHGIGYFQEQPNKSEEVVMGSAEKEVWIPCTKIEYIESLSYRSR